MRIDPPTDAENAALRRALLAAARECYIDPDKPLSLALFVTHAELVAHKLVYDLVRSDRLRHRLTYQRNRYRLRHHHAISALPLPRPSPVTLALNTPPLPRFLQTCRWR